MRSEIYSKTVLREFYCRLTMFIHLNKAREKDSCRLPFTLPDKIDEISRVPVPFSKTDFFERIT